MKESLKKDHPLFSIIMPVYNADKYLVKSLDSITNQGFADFELIIVNDASTDQSINICNSYANVDNRITVLNLKENCGAAEARNQGLKNAIGRFLCFVDADDYIDSDFLSKLYTALQEDDYDYIKCGAYEEYYDKDERLDYTKVCKLNDNCYQNKKDIINQIIDMEQIPLFGYLWNSVYKLNIVKENSICFDHNLKVNEDFAFNIFYLEFVKKMKCLSYCGYHYAKRNGNSLSSQSKNYDVDKHLLKIRDFLTLLKDSKDETKENLDKVYWLFTRFIFSALVSDVSLDTIRQNELYQKYLNYHFGSPDLKKKLLTGILQSNNALLIKPTVSFLYFIKRCFPVIFAKVKR